MARRLAALALDRQRTMEAVAFSLLLEILIPDPQDRARLVRRDLAEIMS